MIPDNRSDLTETFLGYLGTQVLLWIVIGLFLPILIPVCVAREVRSDIDDYLERRRCARAWGWSVIR
jgi:hypothetical protein